MTSRRLSIRLSMSTTWLSCCVKVHCWKTTENYSLNLDTQIDVDGFYPWRLSILILTLKMFLFNVKCIFQLRSIVGRLLTITLSHYNVVWPWWSHCHLFNDLDNVFIQFQGQNFTHRLVSNNPVENIKETKLCLFGSEISRWFCFRPMVQFSVNE